MKYLFILLGSFFTLVGLIGIVVPVLPTTPFLLLSAAFFLRSSEKLYKKFLSSRLFGRYINDFRKHKGMTFPSKIISISMMWGMIILSIIFVDLIYLRIILLCLGITGTVVMGFILKTVRK